MDAVAQLNAALAGRYAIEREIGAGGMATVFLARDLKHDRSVALKLLKPELGAVVGVERFLSEIKVTANLQHPNLLPLFDSGAADGLLFYVMPYVEGESLRARLDREKQLPIDDALHIAAAVASALDYAHRHGVIHRDLKPENILLHEGQPLVADFGIALAVSIAGGARVTQTGLSLGTPQYMSPEQATGDRVIDGRSDIYSLAAVTYEMLTGEPPHTGSSAQAIVARVLTERPRNVRASRPNVPEHVDLALEHALEKLAADRWPTAGQFADALQGRGGALPARGRAAVRQSRTRVVAAIASGVAVLCATATVVAWTRLARVEAPQPVRFTLEPPRGQQFVTQPGASIAISPDGRTIAYSAAGAQSQMLYTRRLDELEAKGIPMSEPSADLKFTPDGRWLSFVRPQGTILRVPTAGGPPEIIAQPTNPVGTSWTADGRLVYASMGAVFRVDAPGSTPKEIARIDSTRHETDLGIVFVLPDGKDVLFGVIGSGGGHGAAVSIDGTNRMTDASPAFGYNPIGFVDGWLVFGRDDGTIAARRFNQRTRHASGDVVTLLAGVMFKAQGGVQAALSNDGTLAYYRGDPNASLALLDSHGAPVLKAAEQGAYSNPAWSPDGRRIAVQMGSSGTAQGSIWIYDVASRALSRLRTHGDATRPAWTSDSKHVAYVAYDGTSATIWSVPADASAPEELLYALPGEMLREVTFSLDGKFAILRTDNASPRTQADIYVLALQGAGEHKAVPLVQTPYEDGTPSVSPDGRWLAYASDETGRIEIYVRPFPGAGGRVQVSTGGGTEPRWTPDGAHIVYRAAGVFWAAAISTAGGVPAVTRRDSLFTDRYGHADIFHQGYDIGRDGRFAVFAGVSDKMELVVVTNWWAEARAKLRGNALR